MFKYFTLIGCCWAICLGLALAADSQPPSSAGCPSQLSAQEQIISLSNLVDPSGRLSKLISDFQASDSRSPSATVDHPKRSAGEEKAEPKAQASNSSSAAEPAPTTQATSSSSSGPVEASSTTEAAPSSSTTTTTTSSTSTTTTTTVAPPTTLASTTSAPSSTTPAPVVGKSTEASNVTVNVFLHLVPDAKTDELINNPDSLPNSTTAQPEAQPQQSSQSAPSTTTTVASPAPSSTPAQASTSESTVATTVAPVSASTESDIKTVMGRNRRRRRSVSGSSEAPAVTVATTSSSSAAPASTSAPTTTVSAAPSSTSEPAPSTLAPTPTSSTAVASATAEAAPSSSTQSAPVSSSQAPSSTAASPSVEPMVVAKSAPAMPTAIVEVTNGNNEEPTNSASATTNASAPTAEQPTTTAPLAAAPTTTATPAKPEASSTAAQPSTSTSTAAAPVSSSPATTTTTSQPPPPPPPPSSTDSAGTQPFDASSTKETVKLMLPADLNPNQKDEDQAVKLKQFIRAYQQLNTQQQPSTEPISNISSSSSSSSSSSNSDAINHDSKDIAATSNLMSTIDNLNVIYDNDTSLAELPSSSSFVPAGGKLRPTAPMGDFVNSDQTEESERENYATCRLETVPSDGPTSSIAGLVGRLNFWQPINNRGVLHMLVRVRYTQLNNDESDSNKQHEPQLAGRLMKRESFRAPIELAPANGSVPASHHGAHQRRLKHPIWVAANGSCDNQPVLGALVAEPSQTMVVGAPPQSNLVDLDAELLVAQFNLTGTNELAGKYLVLTLPNGGPIGCCQVTMTEQLASGELDNLPSVQIVQPTREELLPPRIKS